MGVLTPLQIWRASLLSTSIGISPEVADASLSLAWHVAEGDKNLIKIGNAGTGKKGEEKNERRYMP